MKYFKMSAGKQIAFGDDIDNDDELEVQWHDSCDSISFMDVKDVQAMHAHLTQVLHHEGKLLTGDVPGDPPRETEEAASAQPEVPSSVSGLDPDQVQRVLLLRVAAGELSNGNPTLEQIIRLARYIGAGK